MRILFVAMSDSIHTARWTSQVHDQNWDLHLFPSKDDGVAHSALKKMTVYHLFYGRQQHPDPTVTFQGVPLLSRHAASLARRTVRFLFPQYRIRQLANLIRKIKPDVIHSMEIQAAGYLTFEAKKQFKDRFPPWVVTNWGSDIYYFGRWADHTDKIRAVLSACEYYSCECRRDVSLARQLGFKGRVLPILPSGGGFDLSRTSLYRQPGPPSARRLILLKGYQGWAGRALVGLRAIELCAEKLKGYRVAVYSAGSEVMRAANRLSRSSGISIDLIPFCSHEDMLQLYGKARIYVGLSITDAISTSLLEAMVMGTFPIQSCTSCADEWITDEATGFIVPPEDPQRVAEAIRIALSDDSLVDRASEMNHRLAQERLDEGVIRPQVVEMYENIVKRRDPKEERAGMGS